MAHVTIASQLAVEKKQAKPDFLDLREKGKGQQTIIQEYNEQEKKAYIRNKTDFVW